MKKYAPYLFPLTVLAFTANNIGIFSLVFNSNSRWIFLFIMFADQIFSTKRWQLRLNAFTLFLLLYALWNICTILWSEVFILSAMKSIAFFIMSFSLFFAGQLWVAKQGIDRSYDFLMPAVISIFVSTVFGQYYRPLSITKGKGFKGFTGNSNTLGSLLMLSLPYMLWKLYLNWSSPKKRLFWIILLAMTLSFAFTTNSRAAFLGIFITLGGMILALSPKKVIPYTYVLGSLAIIVFLSMPFTYSAINQVIIAKAYKHKEENFSILGSRIKLFRESCEGAKQGGWIGLGYGVSFGYKKKWKVGMSTCEQIYGREKSFSQLAIVEEAGVIGLTLYFLLLFSFYKRLMFGFRKAGNQKNKVAIGIALGAITGLLAHSCFEAWWGAPGSPECAVFLAMVGVSMGLVNKVKDQYIHEKLKFNPASPIRGKELRALSAYE